MSELALLVVATMVVLAAGWRWDASVPPPEHYSVVVGGYCLYWQSVPADAEMRWLCPWTDQICTSDLSVSEAAIPEPPLPAGAIRYYQVRAWAPHPDVPGKKGWSPEQHPPYIPRGLRQYAVCDVDQPEDPE